MTQLSKEWLSFLEQVHAEVDAEEAKNKAAELMKAVTVKSMHVGVKKEEVKNSGMYKPYTVEQDHFSVALSYQGRTVTMDYFKGEGLRAKKPKPGQHPRSVRKTEPVAPTVPESLSALVLDAECGRYTFEDFCGNFGYDEDSRKAEKTWNACKDQALKLLNLLGPDYSEDVVNAMGELLRDAGY